MATIVSTFLAIHQMTSNNDIRQKTFSKMSHDFDANVSSLKVQSIQSNPNNNKKLTHLEQDF